MKSTEHSTVNNVKLIDPIVNLCIAKAFINCCRSTESIYLKIVYKSFTRFSATAQIIWGLSEKRTREGNILMTCFDGSKVQLGVLHDWDCVLFMVDEYAAAFVMATSCSTNDDDDDLKDVKH